MKKSIFLILLLLFVSAIFLSGCAMQRQKSIQKNIEISTAQKKSAQKQTNTINEIKQDESKVITNKKNSPVFNQRTEGIGCKDNESTPHFREDFNLDSANNIYKFINYENGISFDAPYNKKWGNPECIVNPYFYLGSNRIFFGEPSAWGPDEFELDIKQKEISNQVIENLKLELDAVDKDAYPDLPKIINIDNFEVVLWGDKEMYENIYMEVIGNKYNYRFSALGERNNAIERLEKIIKTIKYEL